MDYKYGSIELVVSTQKTISISRFVDAKEALVVEDVCEGFERLATRFLKRVGNEATPDDDDDPVLSGFFAEES